MRRRVQVVGGIPVAPAPVSRPAPVPPSEAARAAAELIPLPPASSGGGQRSRALSNITLAVQNAEHRATHGEWEDADGRVLVGLYALCHRMVYGVLPVELERSKTFSAAARVAGSALRTHFKEDAAAMVEFVKWTWKREKGRMEWAKKQNVTRGRMTWQLQFSDNYVSDYRVESRMGR